MDVENDIQHLHTDKWKSTLYLQRCESVECRLENLEIKWWELFLLTICDPEYFFPRKTSSPNVSAPTSSWKLLVAFSFYFWLVLSKLQMWKSIIDKLKFKFWQRRVQIDSQFSFSQHKSIAWIMNGSLPFQSDLYQTSLHLSKLTCHVFLYNLFLIFNF